MNIRASLFADFHKTSMRKRMVISTRSRIQLWASHA